VKCKHIGECKQKVSKEIFELFCLKGKLGDLRWHQDDCFKYNDMSFVEMNGELKLPKEWEKILKKEDEASPKTLNELCDYIVKYADSIPVREKIDGKWGSYWLTELPVKLALKHAMRFVKEGRIPARVKV